MILRELLQCPTGCSCSSSPTLNAWNSLWSSVGSTCHGASRPCLIAFLETFCFPSGVRGPDDFLAFCRFAAICRSLAAIGLLIGPRLGDLEPPVEGRVGQTCVPDSVATLDNTRRLDSPKTCETKPISEPATFDLSSFVRLLKASRPNPVGGPPSLRRYEVATSIVLFRIGRRRHFGRAHAPWISRRPIRVRLDARADS